MSTEPERKTTSFVFPSPRPARTGLARRADLPEYLPARMLKEFVYCPRLFFYEWVEGVFAESGDTVEGMLRHERIRARAPTAPKPGRPIARRCAPRRSSFATTATRAMRPSSTTTPPDSACASRSTSRFVSETVAHADNARRLAESGRIPLPLVDSPKCPRCPLVSICLPDETAAAMGLTEMDGDQERQLPLFSGETERERRPLIDRSDEPVRRLVPARDDLRPMYVTGYGLSIGKKDEVLQVRDRKGVIQEARLHDISQVNVFGGVAVTSAAVQALCGSEKPIAYFSTDHWFFGMTTGMGLRNVFLRRDQFARAEDPAFCLATQRNRRPPRGRV